MYLLLQLHAMEGGGVGGTLLEHLTEDPIALH